MGDGVRRGVIGRGIGIETEMVIGIEIGIEVVVGGIGERGERRRRRMIGMGGGRWSVRWA